MNRPKILYVQFMMVGISIMALAFILFTFRVEEIKLNDGEVRSFNSGWLFVNYNGDSHSITLPTHNVPGAEKNKSSFITNQLPFDIGNNMTLSFSTYHAKVRVFVGSELIYRFGYDTQLLFGKSPACTAWHIISLPDGSQGKSIKIEICSPYDKYASTFNDITIGTKSANITNLIHRFFYSTVVGSLVLTFGITLLLLYFIARTRLKNNLALLYQSLFAISISISALTETSVLQFLTGNVLLLGYIMYFTLMLCMIPYLLFIKTVYAKHHKKLYDILCVGAALNFLICTLMQVLNILDFPETVFLTHLIIAASLILSVYTALENLLKFHDRTVLPFLIGLGTMFVLYMVDMMRYYMGIYQDGALFCRSGLLIFVVLPSIDTVSQYFSMIELGMEARVLKRLAYLDTLTQKKNRNAFEIEMEALNSQRNRSHVAIVAFDVNNLKSVNDNYGHRCGDVLILSASDVIQKSFDGYGNCYRVGGDEFVVIIEDYVANRTKACLDDFEVHLREYNQRNSNGIEIAYGYAVYEPCDKNLLETLNRADKLMYQKKAADEKPCEILENIKENANRSPLGAHIIVPRGHCHMKFLILSGKRLLTVLRCLVCGILAVFIAVQGVTAIRTFSSQRLIPIYCVKTPEKKVAISFDAAWGNEETQTLIDILGKYNVKTTFFVVGAWVDKYPESVKALAAAGHEVCNHSNTHPHMPKLVQSEMTAQITECNDKIKNLTGTSPILFRAPYGDYNNALMETVKSVNMYCIQWDVDSLDWKNLTPNDMVTRVTTTVKPGSIVLFHNGAKNTPSALPKIIEALQGQGYQIVPVSQLIYKEGYTIDHTGMQVPNSTANQ
ncbi:polysaccharide deacetylase family protein [Caproiciproducens faecalis]|uniref:Polysaccharide deacetylase family protein n=1 Tax=Caproiciproducens faecalis TaxID=2820301 RepID=A0ABS7DRM5_9FIRM|nr:polysaccharide deacetylase family protein [Caproiciproducens faecalis]MBW7573949.1 polysaccharide deacetylase family protein [Caproiciproducens faecalis]